MTKREQAIEAVRRALKYPRQGIARPEAIEQVEAALRALPVGTFADEEQAIIDSSKIAVMENADGTVTPLSEVNRIRGTVRGLLPSDTVKHGRRRS